MHRRLIAAVSSKFQDPDPVVLLDNFVMIRCYRYRVCHFTLLKVCYLL